MAARDQTPLSPKETADAARGSSLPSGDQPYQAPSLPDDFDYSPYSFSLSSLLLIVVLVAVCVRIALAAPILGIFLCITIIPAIARTVPWAQRRRRQGNPLSMWEKIHDFLVSCLAIWFAITAAMMTFGATCLVTVGATSLLAVVIWPLARVSEIWLYIGVGVAGIAAVWVFGWMLLQLWPHEPARRLKTGPSTPPKICPACQASISADAITCWLCEQRSALPTSAEATICPQCESSIPFAATSCWVCEQRVELQKNSTAAGGPENQEMRATIPQKRTPDASD